MEYNNINEMDNKTCTKCKIDKDLSYFVIQKKSKDGYSSYCKTCKKEIDKEYYIKNKNNICLKVKEYRDNNNEIIKTKKKEYSNKNSEIISEKQKEYRINNSEKLKEFDKERNSKQHRIDARYKYNKSDAGKKSKHIAYENLKKNKPYIIAWRRVLTGSLDRLGQKKENNTIDLLGYSALALKEHIESLFTDGMSWNNYGEWHIDHIIPVSNFNKDTPMHVVNALNNLQPLWATTREINGVIYEGNLNKGNK